MENNNIVIENTDIKLQSILSNGMVLQRGDNTKIYGKATPNEKITIKFLHEIYETFSNENGDFEVKLNNIKAGGPYEMIIKGQGEEQKIKNILIGDVYLCSGQSNMQLPINRVFDKYKDEILNYANDNIRQFITSPDYNFHGVQEELGEGTWKSLNFDNVLDFGAAAYFFAKELYAKYEVPIGIILTAVGGTPIEAWISEEKLKEFPMLDEEIEQCKNDEYVKEVKKSDENRINSWYKALNEKDIGLNKYEKEDFDDSSWNEFDVPNKLSTNSELDNINGAVWFRKEINVPRSMAEKDAKLYLGTIVDGDITYVNGVEVGHIDYRYPPRKYNIPKGILKCGKNLITVRVIINRSSGEFIQDKKYSLFNENEEIDLKGKWKYKIGCTMDYLENMTFFEYKCSGLYNGVIYPLRKYAVKSVLWYQGESNTHYTKNYESLFKTLINNWRETFNNKDLPFLYVQLPNCDDYEGIKWAEIREAQRNALSIESTGMAVTIDIGEYNDLHPLNKKDVGKRLAYLARNIIYHEDIICNSPLYERYEKVQDNKIRLYFNLFKSKLVLKDDKLSGFSVCGEDNKFIDADAKIVGNCIEVSTNKIDKIKIIRYCYEASPKYVTLFNEEGLPAAPFQVTI